MARRPRLSVPGLPHHVTQRGPDGAATFFDAQNFVSYIRLLEIAAQRYETAVHAFVLMTNHVHLLLTPMRPDGLSRTLQYVAGTYSKGVNERLHRTGTLWGSRFRSMPVETDEYCLACYRYIELNPVRAGMVREPAAYPWSSYRANALGEPSSLLVQHPTYLALGTTPTARCTGYRTLFEECLPLTVVDRIRSGTRRGLPVARPSEPDPGV
jgi:putative transposase